jgi:hypothetical protein
MQEVLQIVAKKEVSRTGDSATRERELGEAKISRRRRDEVA